MIIYIGVVNMGIHKYKYNFDFFKKPSEELYYFLGFIAADGIYQIMKLK